MANWSIVYEDNELPLTGRNPFDVVSISGIGAAPIRRLAARAPFQDGDTDLGFRLDPRLVNVVVFFNAANGALADDYRSLLYEYCKPFGVPVKLRCVKDDGVVRHLDVFPVGVLDAPVTDSDRIGASQKMAVQLRASDPIWYDPQLHHWAAIGGGSTGASGFNVPIAVPWQQISSSSINTNIQIQYGGSWASYPIIKFFGPGNGWTLENKTTGQTLDMPNLVLSAGQWLEVDLRYGYKTVVNHAGVNKIGELSDNSDLAAWRLAPAPEANGGANVLRFAVNAGAADATGVQIAYYERYIGL